MSKILITGGQGFLGKKTADALSKKGHEVICFDIASLNDNKNKNLTYKKYFGSILNSYDIERALKGCDIVIHLAALVGVEVTERKS